VPTPGDIVNDRYRLDEPVAQGGMGGVWRATDTVLGRAVAVKMLRTDARGDPAFAARFRDEARGLAALHHPGVVDVYDYDPGADDDAAYLVTAFVEGEPLTKRIATAGRLDAAETPSVVAQTARALDAVHSAGVIHRDVTPGNLIVQPDGSVILIDFGSASSPDSAHVTGAGQAVGTARYMSPEQVSGREITAASDIYSLGVVAYHCLAGRPPTKRRRNRSRGWVWRPSRPVDLAVVVPVKPVHNTRNPAPQLQDRRKGWPPARRSCRCARLSGRIPRTATSTLRSPSRRATAPDLG
jgi:serine/threonine protein kinase